MSKLCFALLAIFLIPVSAFCAIYGYVDQDGVYHMTNIRPAQRNNYYTLIEDQSPAQAVPSTRGLNKDTYDNLIRRHSEVNGVDPHLVKAVMMAESNGNPLALSQKGAQGLMQIMPDTAQFLELRNPFDPEENIQAGAKYLKLLNGIFKGNLELVLAAYNAGPQRVIEHNMAIPPISETISYVKRVKQYYSRLKDSQ
jgi:soluble lytic murein transglycosylase